MFKVIRGGLVYDGTGAAPSRVDVLIDDDGLVAAIGGNVIVGWQYAQRGSVQSVIGLENVSMFWAYLALPVGGVFSALAIVGNWLDPQRLELENAQ